MVYVSSFVYCDRVQIETNEQGQQIKNIISPFQEFKLAGIPGNYSFFISCEINDFDPKVENHLIVKMVNSKKPEEELMLLDAIIPPAPEDLKVITGKASLATDCRNLIFKSEGIYSTSVLFNNELLGEYKIEVKKDEEGQ